MYNLLIVDDERDTRECLKKLVPWHELGIGVVDVAENGLAAEEHSNRIRPDVVICDINMPKASGIEFAQKLRETGNDVGIIFLSAYTDKEYLQSAIKLRVAGYIEKPIQFDEVFVAVKQALEERRAKKREHEGGGNAASIAAAKEKAELVFREQLVVKLIQRDSAAENELKTGPFGKGAAGFQSLLIVPSSKSFPAINRGDVLHRCLLDFGGRLLAGYVSADELVCIFRNDKKSGLTMHSAVLGQLESALFSVCEGGPRFDIAVGEAVEGPEGIWESYQSAKAAMNQKFYFPSGNAFDWNLAATDAPALDEQFYRSFDRLLRESDIEAACDFVGRFTDRAATGHYNDIGMIRGAYFRLMLIISNLAGEGWFPGCRQKHETDLWEKINGAASISELSELVVREIRSRFDFRIVSSEKDSKVNRIITYIHSNYMDCDLSVKQISDHFYLSLNYLCAVFKKATGSTVNAYITRLRLKNAEELIRSGDKKLHEIAAYVGFSDPNYFATVFKKQYGVTPSEYRRMYP